MKEVEKEAKHKLKALREVASLLGNIDSLSEARYAKHLEYQEKDIIEGLPYVLAAAWYINPNLTDSEIIQDLKRRYSSQEVTRKITMPIIKLRLEAFERFFLERGWRLPKWKRPKWLSEVNMDDIEWFDWRRSYEQLLEDILRKISS